MKQQTSLIEDDITEEMLAKRLQRELDLFKRGQRKDNELSTKPKVKNLHSKDTQQTRHK